MARNTKADPATPASRVSPTAPKSKSMSAAVWEHLEAQPGFNEGMERGKAQLAAGETATLGETLRRS